MTTAQIEELLAPFVEEFRGLTREFVSANMFGPESDPILNEWIWKDMSSASPQVGIEAAKQRRTSSCGRDETLMRRWAKSKFPS